MAAEEPADHVLPGWVVARLQQHLQRARQAQQAHQREAMVSELLQLAGYLEAELDTAPHPPPPS